MDENQDSKAPKHPGEWYGLASQTKTTREMRSCTGCHYKSNLEDAEGSSQNLGLYLQDLTFINFADDKLEDKESINFTKRWRQFNAVGKIRLAQTKTYMFEPDGQILEFFGEFRDHKGDEELYRMSNLEEAEGSSQNLLHEH